MQSISVLTPIEGTLASNQTCNGTGNVTLSWTGGRGVLYLAKLFRYVNMDR